MKPSVEIKHELGDWVEGVCRRCGKSFTYEWKGRVRWHDPECLTQNIRDCQKARHTSLKLNEGELSAKSMDGLYALALCSQSEAAQKLAVWEAMEAIRGGATEATVSPVHPNAIQQLERRAILKLRKLARPLWEEYKKGTIR